MKKCGHCLFSIGIRDIGFTDDGGVPLICCAPLNPESPGANYTELLIESSRVKECPTNCASFTEEPEEGPRLKRECDNCYYASSGVACNYFTPLLSRGQLNFGSVCPVWKSKRKGKSNG